MAVFHIQLMKDGAEIANIPVNADSSDHAGEIARDRLTVRNGDMARITNDSGAEVALVKR